MTETRHLAAVPDDLDDDEEEELEGAFSPTNPKRPLALPDHFSFSAASTFEDCPRKWQAKYQWGLDDPAGPAGDVGTFAHAVLEHLLGLPRQLRARSFRWAVRRAMEPVDRHGRPVPAPPREIAREGARIAAAGLQLPVVRDARVLETERKVVVDLCGVPFEGHADKVSLMPSGAPEVVDYKGGKPKSPDDGYYDRAAGHWVDFYEPIRTQIRLYAEALRADDVPIAGGRVVWLQEPRSDEIDVSDGPSAEAVGWLRNVWRDLGDAVEAGGTFEANPGHLCSWCPAVRYCSEGQEAVLARSRRKGKSIGEHGAAWLASREEKPDG